MASTNKHQAHNVYLCPFYVYGHHKMPAHIATKNPLTNIADHALSTIRQCLHNKLLPEACAGFMFKVIAAIKRKLCFIRYTFIIVCALILVLSCSVVQARTNNNKPLEKVKLQLTWYHQFQFSGYYAAKLKGYYREEGLDVEIRARNPNQLPVDAVLSGEADFGNSNSDLVFLRMQGKPVVALAAIMQHSPWCLLVRADSGIKSPKDLIGKTVSMDLSYRDVEFLAMFKYEKIPTEKMHIIKCIPGVQEIINGTVDARTSYISDELYKMRLQSCEPGIIRPISYGIDFYGDTLFTSERQIREYPQRVAAFRRASLRGWQYAMDHPEEIVDYIFSTYYSDPTQVVVPLSREDLLNEATVIAEELMHPVLVEIGHMSPQRWRRIADTYADMGMAEPIDSLEGFIYDPDPKPDYHWVYWLIGTIAALFLIIGVYTTILFLFNKRLHRDVQLRTSENEELAREIAEYAEDVTAKNEELQGIIKEYKIAEKKIVTYQSRLKTLVSTLSLVEERERRKLSEQLHDGIGQALAVIKMKIHELQSSHSPIDSKHILEETLKILNKVIDETRSLTLEISPPLLNELGLTSAIEWLVEQSTERYNIKIDFVSSGVYKTLDQDTSSFLFKSMRELLFNIAKHAKASNVNILLQRENGRIRVVVEDDGLGFHYDKTNNLTDQFNGFGLFNMSERLEQLCGNLTVKSKHGQGSTVTLEMPIPSLL